MHEFKCEFAREFVKEFFMNFVHDLSTKFVRIRANSYDFLAQKIGYVMNGLYCTWYPNNETKEGAELRVTYLLRLIPLKG